MACSFFAAGTHEGPTEFAPHVYTVVMLVPICARDDWESDEEIDCAAQGSSSGARLLALPPPKPQEREVELPQKMDRSLYIPTNVALLMTLMLVVGISSAFVSAARLFMIYYSRQEPPPVAATPPPAQSPLWLPQAPPLLVPTPLLPLPVLPAPASPPSVCLGAFELQAEFRNRDEAGVKGVGQWGGPCTCPDGQEYWAGDLLDGCSTLACTNGVPGKCERYKSSASGREI